MQLVSGVVLSIDRCTAPFAGKRTKALIPGLLPYMGEGRRIFELILL
jgi:hypothetical protein